MGERIGRSFPTWQLIDHIDDVEQQEWDVLITTRSALGAQRHLYVIGIGCDAYAPPGRAELPSAFGPYHDASQPNDASSEWVRWTGPSRARELHVAADLPSAVENLIVTQLAPPAEPEKLHQWLHPRSALEPFLSTLLDQCLAGRFPRPGAKSECWCFPQYAVNITPEIVEVALHEWRKRDPETFPVTDWANKAMWRTTDENRIAGTQEELQAERASTLARLDSRKQELDAQLLEAKRSADTDERRLLTSQGNDLTSVVAKCLSDLGFDVRNMDEIYPAGDRREDLQIAAPEVPGWLALVEVRGYRGGAQLRDLLRIQRFRTRYLKDNDKDVDALWYIVNQFSEGDPGSRLPVLASNEPELEAFAEDGGLAIDTANLFRLWMDVRSGQLKVEEARSKLMQAGGRFAFDD